ncbi:MAG: 2-amino-4-hydroxy-6-hydroxymethyldihydropteridine diphosphokinase [bacterium]|nr:2-amino-4-hydroxy-6-hydroxymethyldihydropteridine diphosphokinase [bacterium]
MPKAYIGIGSNINPAENILQSLRLLLIQVQITQISNVYLTEAFNRPNQPKYYNLVIEIETKIPPFELKQEVLRQIEAELGRERVADKFAPRTIDLDLLLYNDLVIESETLTIPDPQILTRPFIAIPLYELNPELTIPKYNVALKDIVAPMAGHIMELLTEYTLNLRKEILRHDRENS